MNMRDITINVMESISFHLFHGQSSSTTFIWWRSISWADSCELFPINGQRASLCLFVWPHPDLYLWLARPSSCRSSLRSGLDLFSQKKPQSTL
jgi:hypothetical protein